jgi:ATP-dependent helicase HrpB
MNERILKELHTLPVFGHLGRIAESLAEIKTLALSAEPGAGKTTLVPWKLLHHSTLFPGKILLLQPRRIAARAAADRIAGILGEPLGKTVGLRTRLETVCGPSPRLEVVTEGVLVRIIQNDQSLGGYGTVIFDEFHERSLMGDLALALSLDCRKNLRPDLAMLFMSATMDHAALEPLFGNIPSVSVPGRLFPVDVEYHPPIKNERIWDGAVRLVREAAGRNQARQGDILVFLPGFAEIRRTADLLNRSPVPGTTLCILHGRLSPVEQRRVFERADGARRIILATNIAETSITIPGVTAVVDCGFERRVRFSPRTGMGHWETSRISAASAEQRKGRAGRLFPGLCLRWWDGSELLAPRSAPEILETDLSSLALETAAWGAKSAHELSWLTPPPEANFRRALALLRELGLIDPSGAITVDGRRAAGMGLHPRLARMLIEARKTGHAATAALVAALVEEGDALARDSVDFRDRIEAWLENERGAGKGGPGGVIQRTKDEALRIFRSSASGDSFSADGVDPRLAGPLLLLAYPDRAARKTGTRGTMTRWTLAGGRAAQSKAAFSGYGFIVAAELDGGETDGRIMLAAPLEKDDIIAAFSGALEERVTVTWKGWKPTIEMVVRAGGIIVEQKKNVTPPADILRDAALGRLRNEGLQALPWDDAAGRFLARCRFARGKDLSASIPDFSDDALLDDAPRWLVPFGSWNGGAVWDEASLLRGLKSRLGYGIARMLETLAPEAVTLPSGSVRRIDYMSGDIPVIAARLQEFFGCADTPLVAGEPALLHLLSPAGRPVQVTRDLGGFWRGTYHDVRKELMGRYPRHYWPTDPMQAEPTHRAKPRKK